MTKLSLPKKPLFVTLFQILGTTGLLIILIEGFKIALPSILPLIPTGLNQAVQMAPSFNWPTIMGHMPLIRRMPKWLFPIGDLVFVTAVVVKTPVALVVTVLSKTGILRLFLFTMYSLVNGIEASASIEQYEEAEGLIPLLRPVTFWDRLHAPLRLIAQYCVHVGFTILALRAYKITQPHIAPPSVTDIIIEQVKSKVMTPIEYYFTLLIKVGTPILGLLITLNVIYSLWSLKTKSNSIP